MRKGDAGIYCIRHVQSGRAYIGKSRNVQARMHEHRLKLRRGHHDNTALQEDWSADGESAFAFAVIERVAGDDAALALAEIKHWRAVSKPYNVVPPGEVRPDPVYTGSIMSLLRDLYATGGTNASDVARFTLALEQRIGRLEEATFGEEE